MHENNKNRLQILTLILSELSKGSKLSTKALANDFNTSIRKIQLNFTRKPLNKTHRVLKIIRL